MSRLLLRLLPDDTIRWALAGGEWRCGEGLPERALAEAADEVVLLVPAEAVLLLDAPRISARREELERGLPFAVEDRLAAPVEQLVVVPAGSGGSATRVPALAVDRKRLEAWLERLAEAGMVADRVVPESTLLPWSGRPSLWIESEHFVLRFADAGAYAGRIAELPGVLALSPHALEDALIANGAVAPAAAGGLTQRAVPDAMRFFAEALDSGAGFDLLKGEFAARRRRHGSDARLWRQAAALAALGIGLFLLQGWLELRALDARALELQQQMDSLYLAQVPGASRVVDAEAQLESAYLRLQGRGAGGALPLLARIAPALGDPRYALDLIEYRSEALELVVRGPDLGSLESLREDLSRQLGARVELSSAVPGQGGVEGRFRLRGGGA
jgi:general secretion pathway protein L